VPDPFPILERDPVDGNAANPHVWRFLGRLADRFPGAWTLVGGQMVLLLGLENGRLPRRETNDADVLVSVRVLPRGISQLSRFLEAEGVVLAGINADGVGHRFEGNGLMVDVLAPDNLGRRANLTTVGSARTVAIPAGTRLLSAPRRCPVQVDDRLVGIPRPDLDAAIVGKAAALTLPESTRHAEDLAFLLGLVEEVRPLAERLTKSDMAWLVHARPLLKEERVWNYSHNPQAARAALAFLVGT
jgi:hypothetical protein